MGKIVTCGLIIGTHLKHFSRNMVIELSMILKADWMRRLILFLEMEFGVGNLHDLML
jgi:hypothetical protein